jgi:MoCo/4Fe-4S cofactor protein with predicted Tat translocation signal
MKRHWRTLAELDDDPAFLARAAQEFPALADALAHPVSRRRMLQLLAASLALGGLAGCGSPGTAFDQMTVSPVAPPDIIPALPNYYATASLSNGYADGVVVKHVMGRPVKVEGNPNHPASLGATDIHAQAMLLDFYDPARAASVAHGGLPTDRQALEWALTGERRQIAANHGAGFRILTGSFTSPTLAAQIAALLKQYPEARWHQWNAIARDTVRRGAELAYGRAVEIVPHPANADVILALESDLLSSAPGHVRLAREYASRRNPTQTHAMSRVFAVEATPGLMGAAADHHFVAGPAEMHRIVVGLADTILRNQPPSGGPAWLAGVIGELKSAQGGALIHAGPDLPPEAHALVHAMNEALGGRGRTFDVIEPVLLAPNDAAASLGSLSDDMHAGRVDTLLILGTNPVFAAPPALGFRAALARVRFSLAMAPALDETAAATTWFAPETHAFEAWSDARAFDGTASLLQPQALPLWEAISPHELLDLFAGPFPRTPLAIVRETWRQHMAADAEQNWRAALAAGVIRNTTVANADVQLQPEAAQLHPPAPPEQKLHVLFRPDPNLWDGRYANNPWLQELPRPLTKLVWDNPLLISPQLAKQLNIVSGELPHSYSTPRPNMVELAIGQSRIAAPVWIVPGQAPDCVVALLGYGRRVVGDVGAGSGFDFFPLRGQAGEPSLRKLDRHHEIASTDHHNPLQRPPDEIVLHGTLPEFEHNPFFRHQQAGRATLYRRPKLSAQQAWGMSVDLNRCIGCNACVLACVAENNIPVVGKDQVLREREMHWLRIDRYYAGPAENPDTFFQPMLCHHCEEAPCEVVCPVEATLHDREGLNLMIYNRCIGTRFCSNNCPYKVRRFNFLPFAEDERRMPVSRNPDVTARARGVMEKCTFCVQRIAAGRIAADKENRPIRDGEVVTACQAACPTQVFAFGNIADPESDVSKRKRSPLDYVLLPETATHPRLTFEARVRNPNPAIADAAT